MARTNSITLKDHIRESLLVNRRLLIISLMMVVFIIVLILKLAYLQIFSHQYYTTLSEKNRLAILPIVPTRGLIYDRNGILLAQNLPSFSLVIVPEHVKDINSTLSDLSDLVTLSDEDIKRFYERLKAKERPFEGVPLRFRLTDEEVARIAVNRYRLTGVNIKPELIRHYPLGPLTAHSVGYVARINKEELRAIIDIANYSGTSHIGKVGIEKSYETLLLGQVGIQHVETNAQGRRLRTIEPLTTKPIPGKNLYLNIDSKLQAVAQQAFGEHSGALVAMDPNNGNILAMISMPSYDPNLFVNGLDTQTYQALSTSLERPLFNRSLQGRYPPGSALKPFIALAGLELNRISDTNTIDCPGWYMLKGDDRHYRDWKKAGHGETNLKKAIVESCDVYFYNLSHTLGIDNLHTYLTAFGMGRKTGIDLKGEVPGLMPSREWKRRTRHLPWFPGETLITGIGQGFILATPLQLASMTATLANRGQRFQPRMVYAIQDPANETLEISSSRTLDAVTRTDDLNWETIINAMQEVVHSIYGTARRINIKLPYKIAGKTGTAQIFGIKQDEEYVEAEVSKKLRDHALFVAFAPADKPRIAVAVIVENAGSGGAVGAPIVRKVMDEFLLEKKG